MGYDSLIGSHYDEYIVKYTYFSVRFSDVNFDIPMHDLNCTGFPGPGESTQHFTAYKPENLVNPIAEFIHPSKDEHVHDMFHEFIKEFDMSEVNKGPDVFQRHKDNFRHNIRYIASMNRKNLSYKLRVNHLASRSHAELKRMRGRKTSTVPRPHAKQFTSMLTEKALPDQLDWRLYGAVASVKDQATCGSCWSFGACGAIEGAYFLKYDKLVRFSQQNLMDCSWGFGNNACDGGEEWRSYEYIMKHGGLMSEEDYGHYLGQDGYCHFSPNKTSVKVISYQTVQSGSIPALKGALVSHGPVAVGIDAAHLSLSFYSHGVYYEKECGNKPDDLDHAVLAVGYGTLNGEPYTLIKNSWSTHWGNDGYVLMSQRDNNCGVATDATFVEVE